MGEGKGITQAQIRKIYVLGRDLGLEQGLLHEHVCMLTGKGSIKSLSCREAAGVIDSLAGKAPSVRNPASTRQLDYIRGLIKGLGWTDKQGRPDMGRLDGMCRKYTKVQCHRQLDKGSASALIEALKNMKKQGQEGA